MQVSVRDNNVDQALRALKKKLQREGVFREMKLRRHFEKPSEKQYVARLRVGESIVRLPDRYRFPFLIRTEDLAKKTVTDDDVKEMVKRQGIAPIGEGDCVFLC